VWVKDGMGWVRELARDKSPNSEWKWHAMEKYIVIDGKEERYIDEPLSTLEANAVEVSNSPSNSL
jgi:hypothetical protein